VTFLSSLSIGLTFLFIFGQHRAAMPLARAFSPRFAGFICDPVGSNWLPVALTFAR